MANNADEKRIKILETAKRRFAHYGMAKTTMAEIAKDLAFSKALLYYYFPDKNSLYAAVLEHVIEESKTFTENAVSKATSVDESMQIILESSMDFKRKYFYILEYTIMIRKELPKEIDEYLVASFDSQKDLIKIIFDRGVLSKELRNDFDTSEMARVLLYGILGMRMSVVKDFKSDFIPDKTEFDDILAMQKKLTKVFIQGLRV